MFVIVDLDYCECRYYCYCVPERGICHSYGPSDTGSLHNKAALLMEIIKGTQCIMCGYVNDLCTKLHLPVFPDLPPQN